MPYVLILGANSGIAVEIAKKYAENGYHIYLTGRNLDKLNSTAAYLRSNYDIDVQIYRFDALEFGNHEVFYNSLQPKPVGVICTIGTKGDFERSKVDFTEIRKILDTNLTGCISILNIIANDFESRNEGFIVGISSIAGDRGRHSKYIYGTAKAGFTAYLSSLRNRFNKTNIHILTVKPGLVATEMIKGAKHPKILVSKPEDIADAILKAQKSGKEVLYHKWFWQYIMFGLCLLPEKLFKKVGF